MTSNNHKNSAASQMWGGRFAEGPAAIMEDINASIGFDQRFYRQDITASKAHATMLAHQGIITAEDGEAIIKGLDAIMAEIDAGKFEFKVSLEDIHMNVEARLSELIGEPAGRLHTGRSRNDQVATDFKLWVRDALDSLSEHLKDIQLALLENADAHADSVMPGFTHLQTAQPVTLGHHMMAYVEMFARDQSRVVDCRKRMNQSPLGSAALAGTSFPIDREMTARALGFDGPTRNSLDAVSDRDFAMEYLSVASICAIHLSRLSEEIVNWSSVQFGYARVGDAFSTGSSIMPQKRNPDAAELVRGKSGRIIGDLNALLIVMKGLPLSFCKDMQEDKEPIFDASDTLLLCLAATEGQLRDIKFNKEKMASDAGSGFSTATDLADWLVRVLEMPFRNAHHVTGALVKMAEDKNIGLEGLSLSEMKSVEPGITDEIYDVLGVENSVKSRVSFGGTAPDNVRAAIIEARRRYTES